MYLCLDFHNCEILSPSLHFCISISQSFEILNGLNSRNQFEYLDCTVVDWYVGPDLIDQHGNFILARLLLCMCVTVDRFVAHRKYLNTLCNFNDSFNNK